MIPVSYTHLAAVCRAGADWLIGINATRLFSVLYGVTLNVGRVMSPTLALLVQRESDIESFISKPFYVPEITCGGFTASGEKMTERSEAEKIRMDCDHNSAFVRSAEKQVKTIQPPRLYDLTTLQLSLIHILLSPGPQCDPERTGRFLRMAGNERLPPLPHRGTALQIAAVFEAQH